ncbi:DEAD/DEAH box helicase [Purpureocillium lilacinum]|uniref:DEAD/DEAH box helicase n=1 Tax=Purpureocillium lilacinum TaxID=33203 RepID=A0A179H8T2_PURLI|nr:DEAD/DEAH box helicase [Purpureocillium lilacinum]OAQ86574.1 DEAD/DEAH box helicase [Purpureocillium lilacinum]OAQ94536.1 DEAD/DEAH box helicase [Purpureocillium lilacinum]
MADDSQGASPKNEPAHVESSEDAETRAARRELKQSSISDPPPEDAADSGHESAADEKLKKRAETPAEDVSDAKNASLKEHVASPKKKRAHDQLDVDKEDRDEDGASVASTESARDRASRSEPEKKRARDQEAGGSLPKPAATETQSTTQKDSDSGDKPAKNKAPETSASAFAASGFGKLASGTSAFATFGSGKPSAFGSSSKPTLSSFASAKPSSESQPAAAAAAPKLTFGSNGGSSPFAGLSSSNGFGSGLGGGFGSALSGAKTLSSFGVSSGKPLQSAKASKPFGAPDSDSEGGSDEEDEVDDDGQTDAAQRALSPEKETDDKKRTRLQRVEVDDGEAGEATVVSVRAKMFSLDKETGWKERGAGMLKINVPRSCVDYDNNGTPVPGSFDASGLEADEEAGEDAGGHKVVRLLMRQDQTHRVILNTAIVPAMQFQEKASLKSVGILFTAFEGPEAKPMSAANARTFMNEIGMVQKELRGN